MSDTEYGLFLQHLQATEFAEFCFDLLHEMGFVNVDWRKGTEFAASPSDRGRDIVAQLERTEIDGARHTETWFVECKHYQRGVPPEKLATRLGASRTPAHSASNRVGLLIEPCEGLSEALC